MKAKNINKSLLKAISVLKSFTPNKAERGATEVAREAGISVPTAHRILATLTQGELLKQGDKSGKYQIGRGLFVLGALYASTTGVIEAAKPVINKVNELTGETVSLGIFDKGYITVVAKEESDEAFRFVLKIGTVLPAHATAMGKAFLSELTEAEIDALYPDESLSPVTAKTVTSKSELRVLLKRIKENGISIDREGAYDKIEGIASLIRDASGRPVGAMAISVPIFRMTQARRERLIILSKMGTALVSHELGYYNLNEPVHDLQAISSWWSHQKVNRTPTL